MIKKIFKNSKGFSLVEVAVAIGVVSILGVSVIELNQLGNKDNLRLNMVRRVLNHRNQIDSSLRNPIAWNKIVTTNPSFSCFSNPSGCNLNSTAGGYYDFVVYDSNPESTTKVSYDPTDLKTRVSIIEETCSAGTPNPSEACPLKFEAKWKPLCQTYPCSNPQIQIVVALNDDFPGKFPIDLRRYDINIIRDFDSSSIQSACLILNGVYNSTTGTCVPKHANQTCAGLGFPFQVVSTVQADGSITCAPLYSGTCDPLTEVVGGMNANGTLNCLPRPANPPSCAAAPPGDVDCVGVFGSCSATLCGTSGTRTFTVLTPASGAGLACPHPNGYSDPCSALPCGPVSCVGSWGTCSTSCDPGIETYTITTPASGGGPGCGAYDGETRVCNHGSCSSPINCAGSWRSCNSTTGKQTYVVNTPASGGGTACPESDGAQRDCDVDCVGSWSGCKAGSPNYKEFIITVTKKNNGAACSHTNGAIDAAACSTTNCTMGGAWSTCDPNSGTQEWVADPLWTGLHDCFGGMTRPCSVDCVGSFGACQGTSPNEYVIYSITTPAKNGGAACQYADGYQTPIPVGMACDPGPGADCTTVPFSLSSWDSSHTASCCNGAFAPGTLPTYICDGPGGSWRLNSAGSCGGTDTMCAFQYPFGFPPATCNYSGPGTICTDR